MKKEEDFKTKKLKEVARGLEVNWKPVPFRRLVIQYYDKINDECLHRLVINHANYITEHEKQVAWGVFVMQLKEIW